MYRIAYAPAVLTNYRYQIAGQMVRLTMLYATRKDGSDIVLGINIHADNIDDGLDLTHTEVPERARTAIINALVPDRKPRRIESLPQAVRDDASEQKKGEDSAFFDSKRTARQTVQAVHWDIPRQRWSTGVCESSSPGIVQIYKDSQDGRIQTAGIYSEYLYQCMRRSIR